MALMHEEAAPRLDIPVSLVKTLGELLENCRCLARYAVETDQLPASVDVKKLYQVRQKFEEREAISNEDFGFLVSVYEVLERRLGPVNVNTLLATEDTRDDAGRVQPSVARRYVRYLFTRTVLIILLVLSGHLIHLLFPVSITASNGTTDLQGISDAIWANPTLIAGLIAVYLIPFLYGALGADAFLLRETTHKLHTRQFDPRRIPENRARFLLGTLSGGVIVLFVSTDLIQTPETAFNVGGAALGFIAGFSTDFLFDALDRVIHAILPRRGGASSDVEDRRAEDELLQRYRHLMDEADSEEKKKILKVVVEDLEAKARYRS